MRIHLTVGVGNILFRYGNKGEINIFCIIKLECILLPVNIQERCLCHTMQLQHHLVYISRKTLFTCSLERTLHLWLCVKDTQVYAV